MKRLGVYRSLLVCLLADGASGSHGLAPHRSPDDEKIKKLYFFFFSTGNCGRLLRDDSQKENTV
jgi:hypothetical protein